MAGIKKVMPVNVFRANHAADNAEYGKHDERQCDDCRRFVRVRGRVGFFRAVKNDEEQSERVKCREACDENADPKQKIIMLRESLRENAVLAEKSAQRPHAGKRERADEKCPE